MADVTDRHRAYRAARIVAAAAFASADGRNDDVAPLVREAQERGVTRQHFIAGAALLVKRMARLCASDPRDVLGEELMRLAREHADEMEEDNHGPA